MPVFEESHSNLSRQGTRILSRIRCMRTFAQFEDVYTELATFLKCQHTKIASIFEDKGSSPSFLGMSLANEFNVCSVIGAAFSRQVRALIQIKGAIIGENAFTLLSPTDTDLNSQVNVSKMIQLIHQLRRLFNALERFPVVMQASQVAFPQNDCYLHNGQPFWMLQASLSYGYGELHDIVTEQYAKRVEELNRLLLKIRPDIDKITEIVTDLSNFRIEEGGVFSSFQASKSDAGVDTDRVLKMTRVVTPLRDIISQQCIKLPARGIRCVHLDVFDVSSFVRMVLQIKSSASLNTYQTSDWGAPCPFCRRFTTFVDLQLDQSAIHAIDEYIANNGDQVACLSTDHALEWNVEKRTCRVVESTGKVHATKSKDHLEAVLLLQNHTESSEINESHKKRRVEIDGHVLYVEE